METLKPQYIPYSVYDKLSECNSLLYNVVSKLLIILMTEIPPENVLVSIRINFLWRIPQYLSLIEMFNRWRERLGFLFSRLLSLFGEVG